LRAVRVVREGSGENDPEQRDPERQTKCSARDVERSFEWEERALGVRVRSRRRGFRQK